LNTASAQDDSESHHARRFSLLTARYQSSDPLGGDLLAPQSLNLFSYVGGNPMNRIDPFGLDYICGYTKGEDENGKEIDLPKWCNDITTVGKDPGRPPVGGGGGGGGGPKTGFGQNDQGDWRHEAWRPDAWTERVLEELAREKPPCTNTFSQRFAYRYSVTHSAMFGNPRFSASYFYGFRAAYNTVTGSPSFFSLARQTISTAASAWRAGLTPVTVAEASMSTFSSGLGGAAAAYALGSLAGIATAEAGITLGAVLGAANSCLGD